ncbi:CvpA family protein [Helicobacter sp. MIT 05-5293]|uniref:CvpA family protein n=1 Tax=Helicobacter sp. MIT 05-5293 TaxID=1548149 RepID=UPI00068E4CC4|nr:CvpA family protein [Helicobacter sp. MIT 05-5293]TLD80549.1 CvpA family protein [Helicobacter sp. MIT 05-5293]
MDKLSYIDIGILVVLILLSIKGIWQGIIRGLASFLGILLGIFFASRYYTSMGDWFARTLYDFNTPEINALIGFLITITLIWAIFLLLGEFLFRILRFTPLGVLDGALGLIFGFCKAFLIISIIVFGITQIEWLKNFSQNMEQNSSLFPLMKKLSIQIMNLDQVQEVKENLGNINTQTLTDTIQESVENVKDKVEATAKEAQDTIQSKINPKKED